MGGEGPCQCHESEPETGVNVGKSSRVFGISFHTRKALKYLVTTYLNFFSCCKTIFVLFRVHPLKDLDGVSNSLTNSSSDEVTSMPLWTRTVQSNRRSDHRAVLVCVCRKGLRV